MPPAKPHRNIRNQPPSEPEVVSPVWLLKAIGLVVLAALFCGYLTYCLLFYQGQWQLVLNPKHTAAAPASIGGAPYELIHFGPDESATPQLTGWWIPAAQPTPYTILFLPAGDGSAADSIPLLFQLHNAGLNVFAFDYRGYGQSASTRPSQSTMTHDADSALRYLTASRGIPSQHIVLYATGTGTSLATTLATQNPTIPGLILDSPRADLLAAVQQDPRSHLIPASLLFHENFYLTAPLSTLKTQKLLISRTGTAFAAFQTAADPKLTVELNADSSSEVFAQSLHRFLDQCLPPAISVPSPAPVR